MATVPRLRRYYQSATTSCSHMSFGLLVSPAGPAGCLFGSCPPQGAPVAVQAWRRTGVVDFIAGIPLSSVLARGQEQDLPGSLATHPVTLRRSTTPDDPLRLANSGASGAAPTRLTMKASSLYRFRGLPRRFITCCLRFTTGVAARHARLASGWRAAPLPGGSRTRWIAVRGFRSSHPPPQGLAWRNNGSVVPVRPNPNRGLATKNAMDRDWSISESRLKSARPLCNRRPASPIRTCSMTGESADTWEGRHLHGPSLRRPAGRKAPCPCPRAR